MFPDSDTVKGYKQQESKVQYVIIHGLAPYCRQILKDDLDAELYSYHSDETTTSQTKKQYMVMLRFTQTIMLLQIIVERCPANQLKEHMFQFQ